MINYVKSGEPEDWLVVGLFAELGNLGANVSSPIEVTSSVRGGGTLSLVDSRIQLFTRINRICMLVSGWTEDVWKQQSEWTIAEAPIVTRIFACYS
ncbi:hypothetical protein T265_05330 [Opisthorchis viverrini]|uniref:Uncharacterized protein n=1 Tax=Opisthorchis viverrini TaxID=6198 RepID=A0A074ZK64_OPIVI|nr:hypothetical protein T265_05330 [Opisthorchis viverrini]KER27703.1 hypothetical protein T265_05330 [Opisthorchis viverrini]